MSGSVGGSASALLTAPDPSAILQQSALTEYEAEHQIDAIGALRQATVERSNAEAAARRAVQREKAAAQAAGRAKDDADAAVTAGIVEEKSVEQQLADNQAALSSAQERLATLNGQRQAYLAWQKRQAEIRAAREAARRKAEEEARQARLRELARERAQRLREARQRELAREERQRELAREAARQRSSADAPVTVRTSRDSGGSSHHHHHGGGSSGGSSGGGGGSSGEGSSGGGSSGGGSSSGGYSGWTAAKGRIAVHRAMRYLGWSYAWAGGNAYGPTYGVCAAGSAWNDCHIQGFDCSGLTLYGWAPFIGLDHYTVTQYSQAGSYHPSLWDLRAGDLLFWSSNGSISGIHHVAMYIGNGNVIQAPESGSVIQITPMYSVDWGYFGATRPLT
jgi:cell wall-associated NlpC family hydrolase